MDPYVKYVLLVLLNLSLPGCADLALLPLSSNVLPQPIKSLETVLAGYTIANPSASSSTSGQLLTIARGGSPFRRHEPFGLSVHADGTVLIIHDGGSASRHAEQASVYMYRPPPDQEIQSVSRLIPDLPQCPLDRELVVTP